MAGYRHTLTAVSIVGDVANIATHIKYPAPSTDPDKNLYEYASAGSQGNGAVNAADGTTTEYDAGAPSTDPGKNVYHLASAGSQGNAAVNAATEYDADARGNQPGEVPLNAIKKWGLARMGARVCVTHTHHRIEWCKHVVSRSHRVCVMLPMRVCGTCTVALAHTPVRSACTTVHACPYCLRDD